MSGSFDGSAMWLKNAAAPITGYPFSVGCWGMITTAGAGVSCMFSLSDTATANNFFMFRKDATDKIQVGANAGGTTNTATVATADAVNTWFFALGRYISATSRRVSVLHAGGLIEHASVATSTTPSSIDCAAIGAVNLSTGGSNPWPGLIGELWYTNTDVQADGAQTNDEFLRQLAMHGPFSVPHVVKDLIEYHGMRSALPNARRPDESYFGKLGLQNWGDGGAALSQLGPHPPLPYEFDRPQPVARMVMI